MKVLPLRVVVGLLLVVVQFTAESVTTLGRSFGSVWETVCLVSYGMPCGMTCGILLGMGGGGKPGVRCTLLSMEIYSFGSIMDTLGVGAGVLGVHSILG